MGLILLVTLFTLSSCRKTDDVNLKSSLQTFELVYSTTNYVLNTSSEMSYGKLTIWDDDEYFYTLYEVYESLVDKGWGLNMTYRYLGDYEDLIIDNGNVDWYQDAMVIDTLQNNPSSIMYKVPITELPAWCLGITSKVKLNNPDLGQIWEMNPNPRAVLEVENYVYEKPWVVDYKYCIER